MISKQFFEPWRKDAGSWTDVEEASLGCTRRTIHFQFEQVDNKGYKVTPKVLVERRSIVDPKYRIDPEEPSEYWYALRRDQRMESHLAESIRERLGQKAPSEAEPPKASDKRLEDGMGPARH